MNIQVYNDSFVRTNSKYNRTKNIQPDFGSKITTDEYYQSDNTSKTKKAALISFGGISAGGIITWITSKFKKTPKVTAPETIVDTTAEILKGLIDKVKPENKEIASKIFPLLFKNSDKLKLKTDDFETVLSGVNKENVDFIASEGINLVAAKTEKLKKILYNPVEDIQLLFSNLTDKNKAIFTTVASEPERFKIEESQDIIRYITELNPKNKEYLFNELFPLLEKYSKPLKITSADGYVDLLKTVTKETQDVIKQVAQNPAEGLSGHRYAILTALTPDNKECAVPLIENSKGLKLGAGGLAKLLARLKNEQASAIPAVANNMANIKKLGFKIDDMFGMLKNENDAKIFDMIMKEPETFIVEYPEDLKFFLKEVDVNKLDFIKTQLVPKLKNYKDVIDIKTPDFYADLMRDMTPETIDSIDMVAPYAQEFDKEGIASPVYILCGVTKNNIKKLPEFLEELPARKTKAEKLGKLWDSNLIPQEITKMLDEMS